METEKRKKRPKLGVPTAEGSETKPPTKAGSGHKRLTIDLPKDLHRDLKVDCAQRGQKMRDVVRELISAHLKNRNQ